MGLRHRRLLYMSNIICAACRMATAAELGPRLGLEIPIQELKVGSIYYCRYFDEPKLYQIVVEGFTRSEGQKHAAIRYLEPHPVFDTLTVPVEVPDVGPHGHFRFFRRELTAEEKALGNAAGNVIEHGTGLTGLGPANTVRKFLGVQPSDRGGGGSGTRGGRRKRNKSRSKSRYRRKNKTRRV
jgi:hypothetical protein